MLTIALTGGIGCGKTAVTELFQQLAASTNKTSPDKKCSVEIIDADIIARSLLTGSLQDTSANSTLKKVAQLFGTNLFNADGCLQRDKLRAIIFSDKDKKQQLEDLLHPLVYQEIIKRIEYLQTLSKTVAEQQAQIVIAAIPLFFETDNYNNNHFERVLVIDIPVELQIERSSQRDGSPVELIKKIILSQVDRQTRLAQADDIIDNSGTPAELRKTVTRLFHKYCSLATSISV